MQGGNPTLSRPVPNEYGTLDTPNEIEFTIIKCGLALFTRDEQIKIETWLTAPKFSIPLYFVPSGKKSITGPTPYYYGVFTKTEWIPGGKGFYGVKLTFQPTTVYPFMKGSGKVGLKGSEMTKKISIPVVNPDEYIYPIITIKDNSSDFSIQNTSTGDNAMALTISSFANVEIDCKHCIITDLDKGKVLSFT